MRASTRCRGEGRGGQSPPTARFALLPGKYSVEVVFSGGEKRTLRMVARFGDISNWWGSLDELKHKDDVLRAHCEAVGRDPSTIIRTVMAPVYGSVARAAEKQVANSTPSTGIPASPKMRGFTTTT